MSGLLRVRASARCFEAAEQEPSPITLFLEFTGSEALGAGGGRSLRCLRRPTQGSYKKVGGCAATFLMRGLRGGGTLCVCVCECYSNVCLLWGGSAGSLSRGAAAGDQAKSGLEKCYAPACISSRSLVNTHTPQ